MIIGFTRLNPSSERGNWDQLRKIVVNQTRTVIIRKLNQNNSGKTTFTRTITSSYIISRTYPIAPLHKPYFWYRFKRNMTFAPIHMWKKKDWLCSTKDDCCAKIFSQNTRRNCTEILTQIECSCDFRHTQCKKKKST